MTKESEALATFLSACIDGEMNGDNMKKAMAEYVQPSAPAQPERKPTTDAQCIELFHKVQRGMGFKDHDVIPFISGVAAGEHFHGIKETP